VPRVGAVVFPPHTPHPVLRAQSDSDGGSEGHDGDGCLVCRVCNKVLSRPDALRRHMKIHDGIKPYVCSHCGWAFVQKVRCRGWELARGAEGAIHSNKVRTAIVRPPPPPPPPPTFPVAPPPPPLHVPVYWCLPG
jgi:hypothetical protein